MSCLHSRSIPFSVYDSNEMQRYKPSTNVHSLTMPYLIDTSEFPELTTDIIWRYGRRLSQAEIIYSNFQWISFSISWWCFTILLDMIVS